MYKRVIFLLPTNINTRLTAIASGRVLMACQVTSCNHGSFQCNCPLQYIQASSDCPFVESPDGQTATTLSSTSAQRPLGAPAVALRQSSCTSGPTLSYGEMPAT
jgi:hypothetical protein